MCDDIRVSETWRIVCYWNSRVLIRTSYNSAEQGQMGQMSNRYIVISRLIRYKRFFFYTSPSGCVTIRAKSFWSMFMYSWITYIILFPCVGKSRRKIYAISPARIGALRTRISKVESDYRNIMSSLSRYCEKSQIDIEAMTEKTYKRSVLRENCSAIL